MFCVFYCTKQICRITHMRMDGGSNCKYSNCSVFFRFTFFCTFPTPCLCEDCHVSGSPSRHLMPSLPCSHSSHFSLHSKLTDTSRQNHLLPSAHRIAAEEELQQICDKGNNPDISLLLILYANDFFL